MASRIYYFVFFSLLGVTVSLQAQTYTGTSALTASGQSTTANWTAYVPEDVTSANLRAVLLWSNGSGEDRRYMAQVPWVQAFARAHRVAVIGLTPDTAEETSNTATSTNVANLLTAVASASGRASLVNAPLLPLGMSYGGINSSVLAAQMPTRVLGYAANKGVYPFAWIHPYSTPAAAAQVPALLMPGEVDANSVANALEVQNHFLAWRANASNQGRAAFAIDYASGHNSDSGQSWDLSTVILSEALRLRHPGTALSTTPGTLPALTSIPYANGWLAERSVVTAGASGSSTPATLSARPTYPQISPVSSYSGTPSANTASWLPSELAARAYRAFVSTDSTHTNRTEAPRQNWLQIETPARHQAFRVGDAPTVTLDTRRSAGFTSYTYYLYRDGTLVSTTTTAATTWSLPPLSAGFHVVIVESTDGTNNRAAFVTFTAEDSAAVPTNSWLGTTGSSGRDMNQSAAWTAGVPATANRRHTTFDAAQNISTDYTANGDIRVSNASSSADPYFYGLDFPNASGVNRGWEFQGWRDTYLGAGGIQNRDANTVTLNLSGSSNGRLRLLTSQTWSATVGDIVVAANNGNSLDLGRNIDSNNQPRNTVLTLHTAAGRSITLNATISGNGGIVKTGAGTSTLGGTNTFKDPIYAWDPVFQETLRVHEGTLALGANASLTATNRAFVSTGNATLDLAGRSITLASLTGGGSVNLGSNGSLTLQHRFEESVQNSWTPTDWRGALIGGAAGQDSLTINGTITAVDSDANGNTNGAPSGIADIRLAGNATFVGRTQLQSGNLLIQSNAALGASGTGNETFVASGAQVRLEGANLVVPEDFTFNNSNNTSPLSNAAGSNTLSGILRVPTTAANTDTLLLNEAVGSTLTLSGTLTGQDYAGTGGLARAFLRGSNNTTFNVSGNITNPVNGTLTLFLQKQGSSPTNPTFRLAGNNTFTGSVFHLGGTLVLAANAPSGSPGALGSGSGAVTLGASWGTAAAETVAVLAEGPRTINRAFTVSSYPAWTANVTIGQSNAAASTFTGAINLNANPQPLVLTAPPNGSATFSGVISGGNATFGLAKTGNGTVNLAAANTYLGNTTVEAGTLLANNTSGSATGTGAVTVQTGATLGGAGTISGPVTLQSGARLAFVLSTAPGSHERLNIGGALALNATPIDLSGSGVVAGTYTLLQAASITGTPGVVTPPAGFTASASIVGGNQIQVTLASALSPQEQWRVTWFGSSANSGPGADTADPDSDGLSNSAEYAAGTDPLLPGAPTAAAASTFPARLVSLAPSADAYVQQSTPTTAYPTGDLLVRSEGNIRDAYLNYDLAALSGAVESARIVFWPTANESQSATYTLEQLSDSADGWAEGSLTYNTKPSSLSSTARSFSAPLTSGVPVVLDVTSLVSDTLANDAAKQLGLRLYATGSMPSQASSFGSKENSGTFRHPYLHITLRAASTAPTKLMHVGDSITRGSAGGPSSSTYNNAGTRYYLHNLLLAQGLDFRAVGPRSDGAIAAFRLSSDGSNNSAELDRPLLFPANAGYSGQTIEYIRDNIAAWMSTYSPDVVTLMIGTNNVGYATVPNAAISQGTLDDCRTKYVTLLQNLFAASGTVKVVMAKIPPVGNRTIATAADYTGNNALRIEPFNSQVVQSVFDQFVALYPGRLFLVDNYSALAPADMSADGVHPSGLGHQKLARSWHAGLMTALGRTEEIRFANQASGASAALRGGANATTAFGAATSPLTPAWTNTLLRARSDAIADNRAKTLLKFDLANLPVTLDSAAIAFAYHGSTPAGAPASQPVILHLYGVADGSDAWNSTTVTWNTAPGHDTSTNGVLPAQVTYLASVAVPTGARTGDLLRFSSDALKNYLNTQAGTDQLASFLVLAGGPTSSEVVLHGSGQQDYQPPFLVVTASPLTPLQTWRQTHFGTTGNTGSAADNADPDGDGLSNLLEYAFGTTPISAASAALPASALSGNFLTLAFTPAVTSGLTYIVQASSDLVTWSDTLIAPSALTVGQPFTFTDSVSIPTANPPRRFLRLKVIQQ